MRSEVCGTYEAGSSSSMSLSMVQSVTNSSSATTSAFDFSSRSANSSVRSSVTASLSIFCIGLVAQVGYESALLGAEQVARSAYVQVLHGDVYARAKVRETFDGLQAPACHRSERITGGHGEVAECLARTAPHAPAQLVQLAQAEVLRVVDDDGVDARHVYAALDDGGAEQHVVVVGGEVHDGLLQLFGRHLAVGHCDARVGHQPAYHVLELEQALDAVVDKEHLPVARHLEVDGLAYQVVVERCHRGHDGVSVGRWGIDRRQVAGAHQRELQRAWYGGGAHGERVDV